MKLAHPMACNFMVHKGYKINHLKFVFPISEISFRAQHLTSPFINHLAIIHHHVFLKPLPSEFPCRIIHQLFIIHFLINDLLSSKFIHACHTDRGNWTKNNLLVPCDSVLDGFFKLFLCFHSFDRVYSTFLQVLTVTSCSFIISFCNPRTGYKSLFLHSFYNSKNPSSSSLKMLHCWFSALVYLHSSTYT